MSLFCAAGVLIANWRVGNLTIRTRRRGRRSFAAMAAAMLVASVLAVVAGSPAQAANTASEVLVDTNDDGVGDAREFGGRDRYDTALRLAANFGAAKGLGNVPVAFVASGESLVDAVSVSGLAGFFDAPVLLTPSDSLYGGVADFIEDYSVGTVYVLGGSGAVADSVVEDLEALANGPTVNRVAGADRYATAAAAAALLGGGAAWCGGEDAAAVLVNGGDVSLVDAMMVGPIAYRLQLPVLLTAAGVLASATADFIEANDIEHVVIVGGADAVSAEEAIEMPPGRHDLRQVVAREDAAVGAERDAILEPVPERFVDGKPHAFQRGVKSGMSRNAGAAFGELRADPLVHRHVAAGAVEQVAGEQAPHRAADDDHAQTLGTFSG